MNTCTQIQKESRSLHLWSKHHRIQWRRHMVYACFIGKCQIVFLSTWDIFHYPWLCNSDPTSSHPCQHWMLSWSFPFQLFWLCSKISMWFKFRFFSFLVKLNPLSIDYFPSKYHLCWNCFCVFCSSFKYSFLIAVRISGVLRMLNTRPLSDTDCRYFRPVYHLCFHSFDNVLQSKRFLFW